MKKKIDLNSLLKPEIAKKTKKEAIKVKSVKAEDAKQNNVASDNAKIENKTVERKSEYKPSADSVKTKKENPKEDAAIKPETYAKIADKTADKDSMDDIREYVSFMLGSEEYGIDSDYVRQIIKYKKPLDIGIKSEIFFGITNMKDGTLPLVDFRKKFNLPEKPRDDGSIIILQLDDLRVGVYVDYLVGIVRLKHSEIKPIPPFLPEKLLSYIEGVGRKKEKNGKIIIILNHINLFNQDDIKELKAIPEMYR